MNVKLIHSKSDLKVKLVGSWTVVVGDMDQALHLWEYVGGYSEIDNAKKILPQDQVKEIKKFSFLKLLN